MNFSPFSCPIFLGHPEARGRCSQGERVLFGRDLWCLGGTEKAEPTKLQGAGIGPKQSPGKWATEKKYVRDSVKSALGARAHSDRRRENEANGGMVGQLLVALSETAYDLVRYTLR